MFEVSAMFLRIWHLFMFALPVCAVVGFLLFNEDHFVPVLLLLFSIPVTFASATRATQLLHGSRSSSPNMWWWLMIFFFSFFFLLSLEIKRYYFCFDESLPLGAFFPFSSFTTGKQVTEAAAITKEEERTSLTARRWQKTLRQTSHTNIFTASTDSISVHICHIIRSANA